VGKNSGAPSVPPGPGRRALRALRGQQTRCACTLGKTGLVTPSSASAEGTALASQWRGRSRALAGPFRISTKRSACTREVPQRGNRAWTDYRKQFYDRARYERRLQLYEEKKPYREE